MFTNPYKQVEMNLPIDWSNVTHRVNHRRKISDTGLKMVCLDIFKFGPDLPSAKHEPKPVHIAALLPARTLTQPVAEMAQTPRSKKNKKH